MSKLFYPAHYVPKNKPDEELSNISIPVEEIIDIQAFGNKLLILPIETKSQIQKAGFIDPSASKSPDRRAVVVLVGPGKFARDKETRISIDLKPNDIILYPQDKEKKVYANGLEFLIVDNDDILAVVGHVDEKGNIIFYGIE